MVVGVGGSDVQTVVGTRATYAEQKAQLGTRNAAAVGLAHVGPDATRILLVHGDEPLIDAETYRDMLDLQARTRAAEFS